MKSKSLRYMVFAAGLVIVAGSLIFTFMAKAASDAESLSVVNVSDEKKPGYVLYWPKALGSAKVERGDGKGAFSTIGQTDLGYFADYEVTKGTPYTYRVTAGSKTLTANSNDESPGKPEISDIKIAAGAVGQSEASVIITFKTDRLAKSQVFHGTTASYDQNTEMKESLNQSHTVLIEKLKPTTTYHFKVKAQDKSGKYQTESEDQTFTTPTPPTDQTILQIIMDALSKAFEGFAKWLRD